jgi:CxxC motif-containing protein
MNKKEFTCVVCPNGCPIVVNIDNDVTPVIAQVQGSVCKRGEEWVHQEMENPMRTIASSVPVRDGDGLMASVRTSRPIPLAKILQVIEEIKRVSVQAPVSIGDVILRNPANCDTEIVATRSVERVH